MSTSPPAAATTPRSKPDNAGRERQRGASLLGLGLGLGLLLPLVAALTALGACGQGGDGLGPGASFSGPGGGSGGPCEEGATRACHITLGEQNGVLSCYDGEQSCVEGAWGACGGGSVTERAAPETKGGGSGDGEEGAALPEGQFPGGSPMSLSDPAPCVNNPCDPSCQAFDEEPDGGIKPPPTGTIYDWPTGDLGDYPPGLTNKGLDEPCSSAGDCQLDHYCYNPDSGACAHDICATGAGLASGCNACVTEICALEPSCCTPSFSGACAHTPCLTGPRLKADCDSCVAQVCAADPYCCNTQWDSICVNEVATVCKKSCSPGAWTDSCVNRVYSACGAFCQKDAGCAHDKCYEGASLAAGCDTCVAQICAVDPSCCSTAWDAACVSQVTSVCKQSCGEVGQCVPWLPGQKDPGCAGADLTVGVPCSNTIPVCNHGNTTAPSGIKLIHFPGNSNQYPKCSPDQAHPGMATCFTAEPIPPGECISVTNCPGLTGNREIMVNPPGASKKAECTCENNWSLYNASACGPPSCSAATSEATLKKVNMFVTVDKSGSMQTNGWTEAMSAMKSFFKATTSAGLGVALRFWPDDAPVFGCNTSSCSTNACASPLVPLGTLTAAAAPTDAHEKALIDAINSKSPGGGTPMYPALAGATQWATSYQMMNPTELAVVVLITDGAPENCNTDVNAIANLAGSAYTNANVPTYVIGIEGASVTTVNKIAQKGGTNQAFIVLKGANNTQVESGLLAALNAIRGKAVTCELELPNTGIWSPNDVSVTFTPGVGSPVILSQVANAGSCGSGFYYDNPTNPSKITLCPSTCGTIQADLQAKVEVIVGCPPSYDAPATVKEVYTGVCPPGTRVLWGFFAYNTSAPGDSNVVFQARTSADPAQFSGAFVELAKAQSAVAPSTEVCLMAGPAPCPINLYTKLGGLPSAQNEHLELTITANPTSDNAAAPKVNNWEITYSCPASE